MTPAEQAAREFPDPRFKCSCDDEKDWTCLFHQDLAAFLTQAIEQARAEEREACAKIAEGHGYYGPGVCDEIADTIRARAEEGK